MGGHEKSPGTGDGLHGTGKIGFISAAFHQGDGDLTRADHIGRAAAGQHAEEGTGHHGDLGRAPTDMAEDAEGEVDEKFPAPGLPEQGAKEDEKKKNSMAWSWISYSEWTCTNV